MGDEASSSGSGPGSAPPVSGWMRYRSPYARHIRQMRWMLLVFAALLVILLFTLLDRWIWQTVTLSPERFAVISRKDWYQLLRQLGYLPTWIAAGLVLIAADWAARRPVFPARERVRRGLVLFLSAGLGGLAAEIVKGVVRRHRPGETGRYVFDWFVGPGYDGPGLGLASSHAGVAFGAAFMLMRLFPGTGPIVVLLAIGCAWTRLLAGAHFATDVVVAAMMSYAVARLLPLGPFARPRVRPLYLP